MDWRQMEVFKGIDLTDSFVLDWNHKNNCLYFELEASIWPESKHYAEPKPNEYTFYRKAILQFINTVSVSGLKHKSAAMSSTDPDGSIDYGNIDTMQVVDGGFELTGNFGNIKISGGELRFEIRT
ncbi:hypothetical protein K5M76_02960 [Shewanella xiamenensis]|uniref:hypothetical protein n=2 Tax=Shewanella TaxID=22 RepID=UPI00146C21C4|nr:MULTISPECIES: hypothetical protein [Shewanella]MDN5499121.1 hypothetical protein [Shewanella sp.]MDN5527103.1 hypothetical protein [Shewanella sp.]NMD53437.1 hypothetical protein [Shewanella sp. DNRA4]UWG65227.1 hypothetical protein K5M76_02960 [Shewanella xiamenensis]